MTFYNKETQNDCWKADIFARMRELVENMNGKNVRMRHPSPLLAIDETLY